MYPVPKDKIQQVAYDILNAGSVQSEYEMVLQEPAANRYAKHTTWVKFMSSSQESAGSDDDDFCKAIQPILTEWERRTLLRPYEPVYVPVLRGEELRHYCSSDITGILCGVRRHIRPEQPLNISPSLLRETSHKRIAVATYGKAVPYAQLLDKLTIPDDYEIIAISPDIIEANANTKAAMRELEQICEVIYDEREQGDSPLFHFSELDTCHPRIHRADGLPAPDEIIAEKTSSSLSLELSDISVHIARLLENPDFIDQARAFERFLCFTPHDTREFISYITELNEIPVRYSKDRTAAYSAAGSVSVEMLPEAAQHFIYRTRLLGVIWNALVKDEMIDKKLLQKSIEANDAKSRYAAVQELYRAMNIDAMLEAIADGIPLDDVLA